MTKKLPSVLIVDDEPLARSRLKALCERTGLFEDTELASGGREAVAKIRQRPPDILLLDVDMPDLSGLKMAEFCQHLVRMPASLFVRVHRSIIVRRDCIAAVRREGRKRFVLLQDGSQLPIGPRYSDRIMAVAQAGRLGGSETVTE